MLGAVTGPRHPLIGEQNLDARWGTGRAQHQIGDLRPWRNPAAQAVWVFHRRRQTDPAHGGGKTLQPRQAKAKQVAALGAVQGMDLVDDHGLEVGKIGPRPVPSAEQGKLFGGGQQDVRRIGLLPLTLGQVGIAGSRFDADGQTHLLNRGHEVARHIYGQGLERRNIEGVDALRPF